MLSEERASSPLLLMNKGDRLVNSGAWEDMEFRQGNSIRAWIKRSLRIFQKTPPLSCDAEMGKPGPAAVVGWSWQRVSLALIVLLALAVMVLLLFWNYQCIIIQRVCQAQEERSPFPVFAPQSKLPQDAAERG